MKYFLDTNIFMYAAGREHPLKGPCVAILRRVAREEVEALTNTEVLQEILYRYRAIGERERGLHLARLAVDQVGGEVLPVTLADMRRAFDLVTRYGTDIMARDAVHAATMLNNGLTHLISADSHFDVIEGVTRLDPRKAARRP
ncbi:MAG: type II toxin-antitoxin system VapC family toxin [candidate division NC10 bacterium]